MCSTSLVRRERFSISRRFAALICILACVCPAPQLLAAPFPALLPVRLLSVTGTANNTVTSLEFINDVTLRIEAVQTGYMSHFGDFTGQFSYVAIASPVSIALAGTATFTNSAGEKLFARATLVELGANYPYQVTGILTITGGTGRFTGATGSIVVTGVDGEELTDRFNFTGTLLTRR